jgi:hypothetical protein
MEWLTALVLDLAASGLVESLRLGGRSLDVRRRRRQAREPIPDALSRAIQEAIATALSGVKLPPGTNVGVVRKFLESSDTQATVRQIYALRLAPEGSARTVDVEAVRERFSAALALSMTGRGRKALGPILFDLILAACDAALAAAIEEGVLAAHEIRSAMRHRVLVEELGALHRNLALLTTKAPDVAAILRYEEMYRA